MIKALFVTAQNHGAAPCATVPRVEQALVGRTRRLLSISIDSTLGAIALDLNGRLARSRSVILRTVGLFAQRYGEMTRGPGWRQVPMNQIGHDGLAECAR